MTNAIAQATKYCRDNCAPRGEIRTVTKKQDESNFMVNANIVLFINRGQSYVLIDDQVLLAPGGYHYERNVCHDYDWYFITNPDPPAANPPLVYEGNHLSIRLGNASDPHAAVEMFTSNVGGATAATGTGIGAPTDVEIVPTAATTTADFTIAAGKVYVKIRNVGGLSPANITINGDTVTPGGFIERQITWDGVHRYTLPEYDVVTNGSTVEYYFETNPLI
jgi:hypothetical protein